MSAFDDPAAGWKAFGRQVRCFFATLFEVGLVTVNAREDLPQL